MFDTFQVISGPCVASPSGLRAFSTLTYISADDDRAAASREDDVASVEPAPELAHAVRVKPLRITAIAGASLNLINIARNIARDNRDILRRNGFDGFCNNSKN